MACWIFYSHVEPWSTFLFRFRITWGTDSDNLQKSDFIRNVLNQRLGKSIGFVRLRPIFFHSPKSNRFSLSFLLRSQVLVPLWSSYHQRRLLSNKQSNKDKHFAKHMQQNGRKVAGNVSCRFKAPIYGVFSPSMGPWDPIHKWWCS